GNFAGTIAVSGSTDVTVTFTPTAAINYGGTVTVTSGATSGTNTIAISGTGTTIQSKPTIITTVPIAAGITGSAYSQAFRATHGPHCRRCTGKRLRDLVVPEHSYGRRYAGDDCRLLGCDGG